ncbi:hypothetical protein [Roseovarius sp. 2305UL8-3]|uniref:hypothetical protein n=1 Tax=Roseovarius conchicola TaxID=3121636 RepID=UPI0035293D68
MGKTNRILAWILSGTLSLGTAGAAKACAFHGYTPNPTLIDILLATEQVVIARPAPSDPNRYMPLETLAGPDVQDIPIRMTPTTRALLNGKPSSTVLLARDGSYGPWLEIAILDETYRAFVSQVLHRQSELLLGGDKKRFRLFAELLNDQNPDIRRLALQELDRAPYGALKSLRLPRVQNLRQDLETGDEDLMPIRVLLAGLSKDRSLTPYLSSELDAAIQREVPYMGAYATAMIELEGRAAVQDILDRHLKADGLSATTRERLLQALAIQYKTASGSTRRAIARGVADLLRTSPELGDIAARQFGFQSRSGLAELQPDR